MKHVLLPNSYWNSLRNVNLTKYHASSVKKVLSGISLLKCSLNHLQDVNLDWISSGYNFGTTETLYGWICNFLFNTFEQLVFDKPRRLNTKYNTYFITFLELPVWPTIFAMILLDCSQYVLWIWSIPGSVNTVGLPVDFHLQIQCLFSNRFITLRL